MQLRPEADAVKCLAAQMAGMAAPLWCVYVRRDCWPDARRALLRAETGFVAFWLAHSPKVCVITDARTVGLPGQDYPGPPELCDNPKAAGGFLGMMQVGAECDLSPRFALLNAAGEAALKPEFLALLDAGLKRALDELRPLAEQQNGG